MLWFDNKRYKIFIKDKEIEANIKRESYPYFYQLAMSEEGNEFLRRIESTERISRNCFRVSIKLMRLTVNKQILYRGIPAEHFKDFMSTGNSKTPKNISALEREKLTALGLPPERILYADQCLSKAWEFTRTQNPAILAFYDATKFDYVPDTLHMYKLHEGESFKDAVLAYLVVFYLEPENK